MKPKVMIGKIPVYGPQTDHQTRCVHYHSALDIIAIKFACCERYYPCYECHEAMEDHPPSTWKLEQRDQGAILCGVCGHELTIEEYMNSQHQCQSCYSGFNPGCANHYHLYFDVQGH